MGDFIFNRAKGRFVEWAERVNSNDPTNAVFTIMVIDTSASDGTLLDLDSFDAILDDGDTAEVTNSNYARKVIDQSGGLTITYDDTNNRVDLDLPDQTWTAVAAGDSWTDGVVGYDSDSTGGDDEDVLPVSQHDFPITPDGGDITAQIATFARAS